MNASLRIVAIMAVYNEELHLSRCLEHLCREGIHSYIIDNGSMDRTPEIARSFLNMGVIHVERFPRQGMFELEKLLRRKEEIASELDADWYIHHDADEIRQAPNAYRTLAEGILAVDRAGYNAINFDEFVFVPTGPGENYEHDRFVEEMQYYYFFEPGPQHRVNAWKNSGQLVDLHSSGGHRVEFEGCRVYPENFVLRHYLVLSHPHVIRKYCGRVRSEVERREKGWGNERASLHPDQIQFPDRSRLHRISMNGFWDHSDPWRVHAIFEQVTPLPREERVYSEENSVSGPPAPFIVGVARSGTTLLRLMLDSHPDLAIPPETHFIPQISQDWRETNDRREYFLQALVKYPRWDDFHIDQATLRAKIAGMDPFNLTQGLRAFYKVYAERFGKPRWGDKTPPYVTSMELIRELIPEARFIHIIRDGRDVALSVRDKWFGPNSIEEAAIRWVWVIAEARRQSQNLNHYLEIRYEDLILDPTDTLSRVCEFIDIAWNLAMLDYHKRGRERLMEFQHDMFYPSVDKVISGDDRIAIHAMATKRLEPSKIGRWKNEMKISERQSFEAIAGTMLRELGYEVD